MKILVVDDEPNPRRLVEYALQLEGYEVVTAEDGEEALNKVQAEQPDLVILDVVLPTMSGIEVCRRLRAKSETIGLPIIMLSARAQVSDKIKGLETGADEYVTKPIDMNELVTRVAALLDRVGRSRRVTQPLKRGKVLGFIGAKGGVGTTTVALNIALVLAMRRKSVIAVELRSYYGTFSSQLGYTPTKNLRSLLELDPRRVDERELSKALSNLPFGLRVLFGLQKVDEFKEIEPGQADAMINGLASMADYTVIDLPCYPSSTTQSAVQHCDFVALVVEPEPSCVVSGKVTLELLESWDMTGGLVGAIVVNHGVLAVKLPEIRSQLGCDIVGVIPPAVEACLAAQQQGSLLVSYQPSSLAAVNLAVIADRFADVRVIFMNL